MSLEIRINGEMIGYAYVKNEGIVEEDKCLYSIEYFRPEKDLTKFNVIHKRSDGAEKLLDSIFKKIISEDKKYEKNEVVNQTNINRA